MRNWNKLLIGMMILILFAGFFMNTSKNVKGFDEIPNQLTSYNDYDMTYFLTSELPSEINNYRFKMLSTIFAGFVGTIYPEAPITNSKYGLVQLNILTGLSYASCGFMVDLLSIDFDDVDYWVRDVIEIKITDLKIAIKSYKTVHHDAESTYTNIELSDFVFASNNLNPAYFNTFEIDIDYRTDDEYLQFRLNVYVNNSIVKEYGFIYHVVNSAHTIEKTYNFCINNIYSYSDYNYLIGVRTLFLDSIVSLPDWNLYFGTYQDDMSINQEFPDIDLYEQEFWYYIAYQLIESNLEHIEFSETIEFQGTYTLQNFTYDFQMTVGLLYNAKFYYTSMVVNPSNMGDWSIVWNWLRDGIAWICNALLIALQFLLYLLVAGISILFGWLFIAIIIPFIWNVLIFWIIFGAVFLCFYVWIALLLLIDLIIDILLPLLQWIIVEALPVIISGLILIISWIFALLFYLISLGTADILQLQSTIQQFLNVIADFFISSMVFIVKYLPEMLTYILFYFILIGFCYLKITYTKARGFVNRSNQLDASLSAYMMPIQLGYSILQKIKDLIIMWW